MANDLSAFKFNVKLQFKENNSSEPININQNFINYLTIESSYTTSMMPVIYASMVIKSDLYRKIYDSQNKRLSGEYTESKFLLKVTRFNKLARAALFKTSIDDEFEFVVSDEQPNYSKELDKADISGTSSFRSIVVALLSVNLLNAIRSERDENNGILVSGIFNKIDMNTLLALVFEGIERYGLKYIIKPPVHNTEFKKHSLVIPPMNNRKRIIDFLYNKAPFYDTNYTFFVDFGRAYLLDRTKNGVKVNDNTYHDVIFEVNDAVHENSYKEGIKIKNNSYLIYINPASYQANLNRDQEKLSNTIVSVSDQGTIYTETIRNNSSNKSDPKYTFNRGTNSTLIKNNSESNVVQIILSKQYLDGAIFTPNKRYRINNYGDYKRYDGFYYLEGKKEIIVNNAGDFNGSTEFILQKIGPIKDIGYTDENGETIIAGEYSNDEIASSISEKYWGSSSSRHGKSSTVRSTKSSNSKSTKNGKQMVSVKNSGTKSSGSKLGSDSVEKFKNGTLKGTPLSTGAVALGSTPRLTIEEELRLVEENRTKRINGTEVDNDSSGPVKTYKYNENITLSKYINI